MPATISVLAGALIPFITYNTGLPDPKHLPEIQVVSYCEINNHWNGLPLDTPCVFEKGQAIVGASYDFEDGVLRYPQELAVASLRGQATLLHELTHFVQHMALLEGNVIMQDVLSSASCEDQAFESMAYEIEFEWLSSMNVDDVFDTMGTNPAMIAAATSCRPVYETEYSQ